MKIKVVLLLSSLSLLAIVHAISLNLHLYWTHEWIDLPIHFFGGVCVAFGISILPFLHIHLPKFFSTALGYLILAVIIGAIWDLFEFYGGISMYDEYFVIDTSIDFCMDVLGSLFGFYLIRKLDELDAQ